MPDSDNGGARGVDGMLSAGDLEVLRKDFAANPAYRLAQNAVTRVAVDDVAISREIITGTGHSLSILLDDWKVTKSGAQRPVLAVRRAQPAAGGRDEEDGAQGVRVLAEPCH